MANPVFSLPSVRTYKDLRAAVRHGDAVIVKRIHHTVASRLATTYAEKSSLSPLANVDLTTVHAKIDQRRNLTRDTLRVTAVVAGIGAAVWITGETITTPALAMIALLPAVVIASNRASLQRVSRPNASKQYAF